MDKSVIKEFHNVLRSTSDRSTMTLERLTALAIILATVGFSALPCLLGEVLQHTHLVVALTDKCKIHDKQICNVSSLPRTIVVALAVLIISYFLSLQSHPVSATKRTYAVVLCVRKRATTRCPSVP